MKKTETSNYLLDSYSLKIYVARLIILVITIVILLQDAFPFGLRFNVINISKQNTVDYFGDHSGIMLYQFDNNVIDKGGVYSGTLIQSTTYNQGKIGSLGVELSDTKGLLVPRLIDNATSASYSFWINPNASANAIVFFGIPQALLSWNTGNQRGFMFTYEWPASDFGDGTSTPANSFHIYNAGNTNTDIAANLGSTAITRGIWNNVVFSFSQPNMSIYVNGVLQGTISNPSWTVLRSFITTTSGTQWIMGDSSYTTNANTVTFDQVRGFNRALTQKEVSQLFNNP